MKRKLLGVAALSVMFLTGCITIFSPSHSKLLAVQGSEFTQHFPSAEQLHYFVALNVQKPQNDKLYLDVQYENPCDHKDPILDSMTLEPKQSKVLLQSPPVGCVKASHYYKVKIQVYNSTDKSKAIDRLTQKVYATLSSKSLAETLNP